MKKQIQLLTHHGSLSDREPFLVGVDEELVLDFSSALRLDRAVVTLSNSGGKKSCRIVENACKVPAELLTAGTLQCSVKIPGGKEWKIEPIYLCEAGANIEAIPQITALEARIADLEARDAAREEAFKTFKSAVLAQFQRIIENHNKFADEVELIKSEMSL